MTRFGNRAFMLQISFTTSYAESCWPFFTQIQPSSVSTHVRKFLKTPELSSHASIIHWLVSMRNIVSGFSFPRRVVSQAAQTITDYTIRWTMATFIVGSFPSI